jgi:hypothetical protein
MEADRTDVSLNHIAAHMLGAAHMLKLKLGEVRPQFKT